MRQDKRTPMPEFNQVLGIKVVENYRFLGVTLNDTGTIIPVRKETNQKLRSFKHQLTMIWANKLPLNNRFTAWKSLVESQFTYGQYCILGRHPKLEDQINSVNYQTLKGLLNVKAKPKLPHFLQLITGVDSKKYNALKVTQVTQRLANMPLTRKDDDDIKDIN